MFPQRTILIKCSELILILHKLKHFLIKMLTYQHYFNSLVLLKTLISLIFNKFHVPFRLTCWIWSCCKALKNHLTCRFRATLICCKQTEYSCYLFSNTICQPKKINYPKRFMNSSVMSKCLRLGISAILF